MWYPFQSTGRPILHWNGWSFHVYMILLWDFVLEENSRSSTTTRVNSRHGDSRRHDILYWHHVNKYRAMRGNWSELVLARKLPRCHVNTPLMTHCQPSYTFKGFQSKRLYTLFNTEAQWGTQQIFIRGGSARGPILTILYLSTVPFFTKKVPLS